ncbi:uncharacterized protein UPF0180 [Fonticella tunisiensis]|uniref:Uncharacterized protein UPF0180 n=2 Tax=Fonticella tunisiensis TaxID=1096341 RepID=A0A4V3ERY5_9CLOT|nr:uncharacterized protein UPF0180 [Fonticella tunisiensis]
MVISVQDDLIEVKEYLKKLGYEVYSISDGIASDVHIYSEKNMGLANVYNAALPADNGSFFINADNRSVEDVAYMVEHRYYSPLF